MLRGKEAQGVHGVTWPCTEVAHRGSMWQTGEASSLLILPLHQVATRCLSSACVPFHLQSKPGLEGLLEMALTIKDTKVFVLCYVL